MGMNRYIFIISVCLLLAAVNATDSIVTPFRPAPGTYRRHIKKQLPLREQLRRVLKDVRMGVNTN